MKPRQQDIVQVGTLADYIGINGERVMDDFLATIEAFDADSGINL